MGDKVCDERHGNCKTRFESQSDDIDRLYDSRAPKSVLFWTLGIFFILICGSYGYTKTVADDISDVVTKHDMDEYQNTIIKAIREGQ